MPSIELDFFYGLPGAILLESGTTKLTIKTGFSGLF
jgi:hypothetical protein